MVSDKETSVYRLRINLSVIPAVLKRGSFLKRNLDARPGTSGMTEKKKKGGVSNFNINVA